MGARFQDKVTKLLGCNICLDMLDDPKVLHCTHSFCKDCLDSVLKFRDDGSAYIVCPLRCSGTTEIHHSETTNVLKPSVQLRNLMAMMATEDVLNENCREKQQCNVSATCQQDVTLYCSCCNLMLCDDCKSNHAYGRDAKYTPIKYHKKNKDFLPWCEKHRTFASYMCTEGFICLYCKERDNHENHNCQEIETLSSEIKSWVNSKVARLGDLESILQNAVDVTETQVAHIRKSLTKSLRSRKIKCLTEYLSKLNAEEEKIVSEFDQMSSNHLKKYPSCTPTEFISNKPHFEVILKRENVVENFKKFTKFPTLNVELTASNYDSYHPLGNVVWTTNGYLSFKSGSSQSSVTSRIPEESSAITDDQILIKEVQFETLLEEALKVNKEVSSPTHDEDDLIKCKVNVPNGVDVSVVDVPVVDPPDIDEKGLLDAFNNHDNDGFDYITVLCENKREELLIAMMKKRKAMVEMRNCYDWTILHLAAKYDLRKLMDFVLRTTSMDVNALTDNKSTPLHISTCYNNSLCAKILLEHGCDLRIKAQDGRTAFQISQEYNCSEIKQMLKTSMRHQCDQSKKRKLSECS